MRCPLKKRVLVRMLTKRSSQISYRALPADDPRQRKPDITEARSMLECAPMEMLRDRLAHINEYFRGLD